MAEERQRFHEYAGLRFPEARELPEPPNKRHVRGRILARPPIVSIQVRSDRWSVLLEWCPSSQCMARPPCPAPQAVWCSGANTP